MIEQTLDSQKPMRLIHRLIHWRYQIPRDFVLNDGPEGRDGRAGLDLAEDLLWSLRSLEAEAVHAATGMVNYAGVRDSRLYQEIQRGAARLSGFDPAWLVSADTRLAFWINLYNALMIDAVIRFDVRGSVMDIPGFFWRAAYQVGRYRFNAFDIEYGILRANGSHPAIPGPQFGGGDPRRAFALKQLDPRVHFALVCAARSCPPIGVYAGARIDSQLDRAARSFINNGGLEIDLDRGEVRLSKIFQWYAPDFGGSPLALGDRQPLLSYAAQYLNDPAAQSLLQKESFQVVFQNYDWRLNKIS